MLDIGGDIAGAGAALAGLLLVFMGSIATGFDSYEKTEKNAVRRKFQRRVWFAFIGFALAIMAAFLALLGMWLQFECAVFVALVLLFVSFGWVIAAALRAALDVK
jgi:pilus assembly protein TadC